MRSNREEFDFREYMLPRNTCVDNRFGASYHIYLESGHVFSIQANDTAYCDPQRCLMPGENPTVYETFEIAFLSDNDGLDWVGNKRDGCISPRAEGSPYRDKPWAKQFWTVDTVAPAVKWHDVSSILKDICPNWFEYQPKYSWDDAWYMWKQGTYDGALLPEYNTKAQ